MHPIHQSERHRSHFTATVAGFPRIGPHHELPRAINRYRESVDGGAEELSLTVAKLSFREASASAQGGLDSVPVGTFSFHDRMLDAAAMYGAVPARVDHVPDHVPDSPDDHLPTWIDRYLAVAHGDPGIDPLPSGTWFGTPLRYTVPELDPARSFSADAGFLAQQLSAARRLHLPARAVLIGPATFLSLSLTTDGTDPLERLGELVDVQCAVLTRIAATGTRWVQVDEPILSSADEFQSIDSGWDGAVTDQWSRLVDHAHELGLRILAQTYFGPADRFVRVLSPAGVDALGIDLVDAPMPDLGGVPRDTLIVAGLIDGHGSYRTDLDRALSVARELAADHPVAVSTSCSLVHAPYRTGYEAALATDPALRAELALERVKFSEVTALARALHHPGRGSRFSSVRKAFAASRRAHGVEER